MNTQSETEERLQKLLEQDSISCREWERTAFDVMTEAKPGLVLFGAGGLGRKVLTALRADGIEPLGFIDNKLAGHVIEGVQVYTPAQAAEKWRSSASFVITIWASWADTVKQQIQSLRSLGCESVLSCIPLLWKYPALLPHVQIDLPSKALEQKDDILRAMNLWADEPSRKEYVAQLQWRLQGNFDSLGDPFPNQYWQRDLIRLPIDAVFADAGAFDGDTFAGFVEFTGGHFRKAFLFEPDRKNVEAIVNRLSTMTEQMRSRVQIIDSAVAEKEYDISFSGGAGLSSAPGPGSEVVHCVSLDQALTETPSFIKYDIEGFELLGLEGARRVISETTPNLAVCAYHTQSHLWQIPLFIHSINPNYKYYLRPHGQIWETVCYAIPK